jgi:hypothetical protein
MYLSPINVRSFLRVYWCLNHSRRLACGLGAGKHTCAARQQVSGTFARPLYNPFVSQFIPHRGVWALDMLSDGIFRRVHGNTGTSMQIIHKVITGGKARGADPGSTKSEISVGASGARGFMHLHAEKACTHPF